MRAMLAVAAGTVVALGCGVLLARVAAGTARSALAGAPVAPEDALLGVLAGVGVLVLLWLVLGVLLEALARVPGTLGRAAARASAALSPRVVRRVAALALGVGVGAGPTVAPALAAPAHAAGVVLTQAVAGIGSRCPTPAGPAPPTPAGPPPRRSSGPNPTSPS